MHVGGFVVARAIVLAGMLTAGWCGSKSLAQGSTGGTIGKTDKSLSGSGAEPERAVPSGTPKSAVRPAPAREAGGSAARFDGTWTFVATGCGAGTKQGTISAGRISIGDGGGTVSGSGAMRCSFTTMSGVRQVAVGRLTGATGSGTYSRPNGCSGSWTASKQ